ncbi:MAG: LacI family DNA-binding transcriptional regulator [Phycisphaerales bacterium]|nr:LacI family DNA-binding transcriptional regulator [Phycisphaerales bacterium]
MIQSKRGTSVLGKSERVVALLERSLGGQRFAVGDRFFSSYDVAREYHVSQGTAHKAMAELVRRGYLESSHRSGYFVRQLAAGLSGRDESQDRVGRATTTTLLMIVGDVGQWGDQLLEQYSQAVEKACRRVGWRLLRIKNDAREIEKVQEDVKVAGCLTYGLREAPAASIDPATIISWGGRWRDQAASRLRIDAESSSRQAFEHLWDLGHERTAMIQLAGDTDPDRKPPGGVLGMRKAFAALGHAWRNDDLFTVWPDGMEGLYEQICDRGITGVFSQDWEVTIELYRQAHQCGERIGDQLSIVASGGHDLANMVQPRPARTYWRFADFAGLVVETLENLSQGQRLPYELVLPVFLEEGPGARQL